MKAKAPNPIACRRLMVPIALFLLAFPFASAAQQKSDSLMKVIASTAPDSVRLDACYGLLWTMAQTHDPRGRQYFEPALSLARSEHDEAHVHSAIGRYLWAFGEFDQAITEAQRALDIFKELGDRKGMASQRTQLGQCFLDAGRIAEARSHFNAALRLQVELGNRGEQANLHNLLANLLSTQGDLVGALREFQAERKLHEVDADTYGVAICISNLADIQLALGHHEEALALYTESLSTIRKSGRDDLVNISSIQIAMGDVQLQLHQPSEAEQQYRDALATAITANIPPGIGVAYERLGRLQVLHRNDQAALDNFLHAAEQMEKGGLKDRELAGLYRSISMCCTRLGRYADAAAYADSIHAMASTMDSRAILADHLRCAEFLDSTRGQWKPAYFNGKRFTAIQDSIIGTDARERIAQAGVRYDYEKQMLADSLSFEADKAIQVKEIQKQKVVRNGFIAGFAFVGLFALVFFVQRNRISKARKRSDELLLNILPEEVAEELKAKGEAEAVHIDQVTVLFTDFKGFTAMSEVVTPRQLVHDLHECFSAFDKITEKHGIEKIKTIGDAYMAAGGLPTPNTTHATDVIKAALEMRDFIAEGKSHKIAAGLPYFEVRIGIHTGPVVAGIVGVKKFQYDIWGDTVNTASRMESSGEVGQVNISEATYALVKNETGFSLTSRGKVQAKGKGEMEMYFVDAK